jgi:hypothetical protein
MSVQEDPVTSRITIPRKQTWSETRGLWQPRGCESSAGGSSGSMVCQIVSITSGSRARVMMSGNLHCVVVLNAPDIKPGQPDDRWMVTYSRGPLVAA